MDSEQRTELKEGFAQFDLDHDGLMQFDEFREFIATLDSQMSTEECRIGFAQIDADHNDVISFDEFATWWVDA